MTTENKLLPLLLIFYLNIFSANGRPYHHSAPMEQMPSNKDKGYVFINLNGRGHQVPSADCNSWEDESMEGWSSSNSLDSWESSSSDLSWGLPSYENDDLELHKYRKYRRPRNVHKNRKYHAKRKFFKKPHHRRHHQHHHHHSLDTSECSHDQTEEKAAETSCDAHHPHDNAPPIDCSCEEENASDASSMMDCGCSEEDSESKDAFYLDSVSDESSSSSDLHCSCYEKATSTCGENVIECSCSENHSSDATSWSEEDFSCSCKD